MHDLTPLPAYAGHTITVGWQRGSGTHTFYASAVNLGGNECIDDCPAHLIAPLAPEIITDAAMVLDLVRPYAEIPPGLLTTLETERAACCLCPHRPRPDGKTSLGNTRRKPQ